MRQKTLTLWNVLVSRDAAVSAASRLKPTTLLMAEIAKAFLSRLVQPHSASQDVQAGQARIIQGGHTPGLGPSILDWDSRVNGRNYLV